VPFKKLIILIEAYKILMRHYLIGIAITVLVFWSINEIPGLNYFRLHSAEWISTLIAIPIIGILISKIIHNRVTKTEKGVYFTSIISILVTWILTFYIKVMTVGIIDTIIKGRPEFIDSIIGFTIYQLWIYIGLVDFHGLIGGIFLKIDLKYNIEKIKNGPQQWV
jgi:hypothetical protein